MNIYVLQTEEAQKEAWELMNPIKTMISDQTSSVINGPVQDHLTGSALITDDRVVFTRDQFMQCVAQMKDYDLSNYQSFIERASKFYKYPYRGKTVFSIMFPANFCYQRKNSFGLFKVVSGIIVSGRADGDVIYDILHQLKKLWGDKVVLNFSNNINYLINWYLQAHYCFSIGLDDCLDSALPSGPLPQGQFTDGSTFIPKRIITRRELLQKKHEAIRQGEIEVARINADSSYSAHEKELYSNNALNACMGDEAVSTIHPDNAMNISYLSKGKGKLFNLVQLRLFIGQQNIYGVRPQRTTANGRRCNIYCPFDDDTPKYRGFVEQSYIQGMSPLSFIFHSMGAREGLVNTTVTTADTGYSQRRMIKKNENNSTDDEGIVRGCGGRMIQPLYGGDGLSARELIRVPGFEHPQFIDIGKTLDSIIESMSPTEELSEELKLDELWMFPMTSVEVLPSKPKPFNAGVEYERYAQLTKELLEKLKLVKSKKDLMKLWSKWWTAKESAYLIKRTGKAPILQRNSPRFPTENDDGLTVLHKDLMYSYELRSVTHALDSKGNIRKLTDSDRAWCRKNWISIEE